MPDDLKDAAVRLFQDIQADFPALHMRVDSEDRNVDVSVEIPTQIGLDFRVDLNLQNRDELHLSAGDAFWCSWFPFSDSAVVQRYRDAVTGLLSGRHRIVEYRHSRLTIGADLQEPIADGWKTIAKSRRGLWLFRWGASTRVVQNRRRTNVGSEDSFHGIGRANTAAMSRDDLPDPLPVGYQLGRLIIQGELPRTSLGRLYEAQDPSLDRTFAVYVLAVELRDRKERSRLWRAAGNASLAGQLVYDVGECLGVTYAVVGFSEDRGALVDLAKWEAQGPFAL